MEIEKLHKVLLMIASDIIKLCDDNNIDYYLDGGSFLGAVRHKGFIPWDDDFDILMKREDYEKFLRVCEEKLDKEKYFIQTELTDNNYAFSFAKIRLNGTEFREDFSWNAPIHHGIFVDIFPYDNMPNNVIAKKIFLLKNSMIKSLLWVKCGFGSDSHKRTFKYKLLRLMSCFVTKKFLFKSRNRLIKKYNNKKTEYSFNSDYPNMPRKNELFLKNKKYKFEGYTFNGVEDYNEFLTELYGSDYMTLPPVEKRQIHSHYEINYGKYK